MDRHKPSGFLYQPRAKKPRVDVAEIVEIVLSVALLIIGGVGLAFCLAVLNAGLRP